jgi:ABC-type amino acid transport substrate-binding protein
MKPLHVLLIILLSAMVSTAAGHLMSGTLNDRTTIPSPIKESRFEQVKRTGVLRCGYTVWPPYLIKDLTTGKMSGAFYDIIEEIGRQLKLKIDWTAETASGSVMADLALNKFDMACSVWAEMPTRTREGDFAGPLFFIPAYLYVRKDDARFDNNYDRANQPDIKFAAIDGDFEDIITNERFPAAGKYGLPQVAVGADLFLAVADKKADAVALDPNSFADYNTTNPDKLRPAAGKPLSVFEVGMPIPPNEPAFKAMLNTTIAYLHNNGFIGKTLDNYEGSIKSVRVAKTYAD